MLRRLYVKGSLTSTPEGVRFQLKNSLGSGYAKGMLPVSIDEQQYPLEETCFIVDGAEVPFSSVSEEVPFTISMNKVINILVKGAALEPGLHKLEVGFVVPGLGKLRFNVKDTV
ncbi:MAG: hypothetical protein V3U26_00960 [Dehalococcoidia bacterium]